MAILFSTAGDFVVTNLFTGFGITRGRNFFDVATIALTQLPVSRKGFIQSLFGRHRSHNASGYEDFETLTLAVRANIVDEASVPEPAVLLLLIPRIVDHVAIYRIAKNGSLVYAAAWGVDSADRKICLSR